jgi:phospholipase/carboxylesterase
MIPDAGLVAPCGDVSEGGANRFFRRTAEGVYDMADLARRRAAMAAFVADMRAVHPGRAAFALGYSNGANILAAMTFEHADLFDRIALLHPLIPWQPAPNPGLAGRPVLITAGRRDPIAPLGLSEALADYYRTQGAGGISEVHDGGHDIRPLEVAALTRFLSGNA